MGRENILMICVTDLQQRTEPLEGTIEERLAKIAQAAKTIWITSDEDERFKSSIATLLLSYPDGSEERERIEAQVRRIKAFGRAVESQIGDDFVASMERETAEPVDILGIWRKAYTGEEEEG